VIKSNFKQSDFPSDRARVRTKDVSCFGMFKKIVVRTFIRILKFRGAHFGTDCAIGPGFDWIEASWRNVTIKDGVVIGRRAWIQTVLDVARVTIGARTSIGRDVVISAAKSITIGNDCLLSYRVSIIDHDHEFECGKSPVSTNVANAKGINIGDRTFIGANSIILKGVTIGEDSIVGAGSIVTKSFPSRSIIAGNPASLIGSR